jgi:16S rRNA (guanine527-N7)-methyltransferase
VTAAGSQPESEAAVSELVGLASKLGVTLDAAQSARLLRFGKLLLRWNRVHNLTAIAHPDQVLSHHLLDSLAVAPTLLELAAGRALRVLDVGAGGGLPGIPLAVALPALGFTLLDKVEKKVAFLVQAKGELSLENVELVHSRVETYSTMPFDVILARAFTSLADLVRLSRHLLSPHGHWCALKGTLPRDEIDALEQAQLGVRVTRTVKLRVPRLNAERHLVLIEPS